jgi:hypothetical protein
MLHDDELGFRCTWSFGSTIACGLERPQAEFANDMLKRYTKMRSIVIQHSGNEDSRLQVQGGYETSKKME